MLRGSATVLEPNRRPEPLEGVNGPFQDQQLGALDVDLHEPGVDLPDLVIQSARPDRDPFQPVIEPSGIVAGAQTAV